MSLSLRYRLIFTIVIVAAIAVGIVGLLSSRATSIQLSRFLSNDLQASLERFRPILEEHYRQSGGWADIGTVLDRIGSAGGKQLILLNPRKDVLAASPSYLRDGNIKFDGDYTLYWYQEKTVAGKKGAYQYEIAKVPHISLNDENGAAIGTLCIVPVQLKTTTTDADQFIGSVNRSLLIAAVASALVAALFAIFLARRIVRPVEALTLAAERMKSGDLDQRVDAHSTDEIGKLASAFNSMADSLSLIERQRRSMISDIAHELRTPLTNVRCQIEAVQDGIERPTVQLIDSIHEEVMLLTRLMDDLQELALAEAGQLRLSKEPFDIGDEISKAVNALKRQAETKRLSVEVNLQAGLPAVVGDAQRIGQVLRNILQNALKHTPSSGKITLAVHANGSNINLKVADTGSGIAPDHLPHVFDRFYRADPSRDRTTGGPGLGLAIVKQLIEAHGGSARVESAVGRGTTVSLSLPINGSEVE